MKKFWSKVFINKKCFPPMVCRSCMRIKKLNLENISWVKSKGGAGIKMVVKDVDAK